MHGCSLKVEGSTCQGMQVPFRGQAAGDPDLSQPEGAGSRFSHSVWGGVQADRHLEFCLLRLRAEPAWILTYEWELTSGCVSP